VKWIAARAGVVAVAAQLISGMANAQMPRTEQAQIDVLLRAVADSGCQVERNGSLHGAAEAEAHLRMKLARAGSRVQTAQQFIDHVASGSSVSGKPYRMICPGQPPLEARDWLQQHRRAP
jgi:hypothetical protein